MTDTTKKEILEDPDGIEDMLYALHRLPPEFDDRCREAGRAAYVIGQLRRVIPAELGPSQTFGEMVNCWALQAEVSLDPVLTTLGCRDFDKLRASTAGPFIRLARLLGFGRERTLELLTLACQATVDPEAWRAAQALARGANPTTIGDSFRRWEASGSDEIRAELEEIRKAVHREYDEMG